MIKKYLLRPIIIFITICGSEDADVSENNETVQNTINSSVEEPTTDLITAVIDDDLETVNQHIAYGSDLNIQDGTFSNTWIVIVVPVADMILIAVS